MQRRKSIHTDPVCGMPVDPTPSAITITLDGRKYYFCAESCRQAFEQHPGKFLASERPGRKGPWGRYLERLNRCTGGKTPKCH